MFLNFHLQITIHMLYHQSSEIDLSLSSRMLKLQQALLVVSLSSMFLFQFSLADIGTASQYLPPYTPTACYGNDLSQFPISNLFAAAGESIWDNGAACGRQYLVRCLSAVVPGTCVPGQIIQVKIVDRAQTSASRPSRDGSSLVLSNTAFQTISVLNPAVKYINVEFREA